MQGEIFATNQSYVEIRKVFKGKIYLDQKSIVVLKCITCYAHVYLENATLIIENGCLYGDIYYDKTSRIINHGKQIGKKISTEIA